MSGTPGRAHTVLVQLPGGTGKKIFSCEFSKIRLNYLTDGIEKSTPEINRGEFFRSFFLTDISS